jgi:hypothetical protein
MTQRHALDDVALTRRESLVEAAQLCGWTARRLVDPRSRAQHVALQRLAPSQVQRASTAATPERDCELSAALS